MKMQNSTLPKFGILILGKFGFQKNAKSGHQNLKFDFDFEILDPKFDFENFKIGFSNSSRILSRDIKN